MRKADIVPGVVYAYREYEHSSQVSAVMVLDTGHLYRNNGSYYDPAWLISKAVRPKQRSRRQDEVGGYLVATAVTATDLEGASLEEALSKPLADKDTPRTYNYTLHYQFTKLVGPYYDVLREREAARLLDEQNTQDMHARNLVMAQRFQAAANALGVHGGFEFRIEDTAGLRWQPFEFDRERAKTRPPCKFVLKIEDVEALVNYITRLEGGK